MFRIFKTRSTKRIASFELDDQFSSKSQEKKRFNEAETSSSLRVALNSFQSLFSSSSRHSSTSTRRHSSTFAPLFFSLPESAIQAIGGFLRLEEWNSLLQSSNAFLAIRKHSGYFDLNASTSYKFYYIIDFQQNLLNNLLTNSARQLSLTFDGSCNVTTDFLKPFLSAERKIHRLRLKDCQEISRFFTFGLVEHLIIENCSRFNDLSPFQSELDGDRPALRFLEILSCRAVRDVSPLKNIARLTLIDISPAANLTMLGNHQSLKIGGENTIVPNVSMFRGLRSLDLSHCFGFRQVQALALLHRLDLSYCRQLKEVSALGEVYYLNLSFCEELEEVEGLGRGNVVLLLSGCGKISEVSHLGQGSVQVLDLSHCRAIRDVSSLKTVSRLNLSDCNLSDRSGVHSLGQVSQLDLSLNPLLCDISGLGRAGQHSVNLADCVGIRRFSSLSQVKRINLRGCQSSAIRESLAFLQQVEVLTLSQDYYDHCHCRDRGGLKLRRSASAPLQEKTKVELKPRPQRKLQELEAEQLQHLLPKHLRTRKRKVKVVIDELTDSNHSTVTSNMTII